MDRHPSPREAQLTRFKFFSSEKSASSSRISDAKIVMAAEKASSADPSRQSDSTESRPLLPRRRHAGEWQLRYSLHQVKCSWPVGDLLGDSLLEANPLDKCLPQVARRRSHETLEHVTIIG